MACFQVLTRSETGFVPIGDVHIDCGGSKAAAEEALRVYPQVSVTFAVQYKRTVNGGGITFYRRVSSPTVERVTI